ncbi:unnamed protein product [Ostreobium quekettii]|uniref:BTB domain-containing protein n=1 Tax=Ostreobium quekettii TaxID=121088 RepID=A0A8S1INB3_9CHLO|nr:unnamed protein product [Ostreobium quekettii]|eukprot:evm.model.scf_2132.1 EVM.evm.TU.scf_2132.1   scf_2132:1249-2718(-)
MTEYRDAVDIDEQRKLLLDVARLRDRPDFHDVTFVCQDGVRVRANRALLAARCEFFDRLLYGDLREAKEAVINLRSVSSSSLGLVLDYLHTCSVSSLGTDSVAHVEAYDLARQYDLPGLQRLIVDFLVRRARDGANVGALISTALQLRATDVAETMLPVLSSGLEEGKIAFDGFSVDALIFCLMHPRLRIGRPSEFLIFRMVLHWAVKNYADEGGEGGRAGSLGVAGSPKTEREQQRHALVSQADASRLRAVLQQNGASKMEEWTRVLMGVRFECIPTDVLQTHIEPLELVPMDSLLHAYRTQASQFSRVALRSTLWDYSCRGSGVRIEQDVCEFRCSKHQGARTRFHFTSGVHSWELHIAQYCDLVWVGVVDETVNMEEWLGKQSGGWMFGSNGSLCHATMQDNGPYTQKYGAPFREDHVVTVKLDMNRRELGFGVNGEDFGVAFTNLPDRVYPAVSCRHPGQLRLCFGEEIWTLLDSQSQMHMDFFQ